MRLRSNWRKLRKPKNCSIDVLWKAGLEKVDPDDRNRRLAVGLQIDAPQLRNRGVIYRSPSGASQELDSAPKGPACGREALEHRAQLVLFRGRCLQPHLRFAIAQRDLAPFRIGAEVEFAARRLGPDVVLDQLPERGLGIQKPLQVFAIGAYLTRLPALPSNDQ